MVRASPSSRPTRGRQARICSARAISGRRRTGSSLGKDSNTIREREPGTYQLTMDDGAQWRFAESVGLGYRLPRAGSNVEIERGSLGSYLLRFDDQQAVPVVRVR